MQRVRLLGAAAALLGLAGCAVQRPPDAVDPRPPAAWHGPRPRQPGDLAQWWTRFDDPLLVELVNAAQAASPSIAAAGTRIAEARAARVAAGAARWPGVDGTASASRGNTTPPAPLASVAQLGAQASWEIDLFGRNRATLDAAEARLAASEAGWHGARVAVGAETALAYFGLRTCERQLAVARNDARSRAETSRLTGLSAQAGFTAPAVAALARASAAEAAARATQQQAQCDLEVKGLVALTALPETALRERLARPWDAPGGAVLAPVPAVPAALLGQRPDVFQAEREVAAASADVGAARADRYPRLTLNGSVAVGVARTGGVTSDLQTWSIGPLALSVPLFDGGRRAAAEDAATARYDEAAMRYVAQVRQAVREVEEALVNLESARARNADALVAAEGYRASFAATEARYRSGLGSLIELEDQRRAMLAAETALVTLQRERFAAWIALYRAVGGGWTRPDAGPADLSKDPS